MVVALSQNCSLSVCFIFLSTGTSNDAISSLPLIVFGFSNSVVCTSRWSKSGSGTQTQYFLDSMAIIIVIDSPFSLIFLSAPHPSLAASASSQGVLKGRATRSSTTCMERAGKSRSSKKDEGRIREYCSTSLMLIAMIS